MLFNRAIIVVSGSGIWQKTAVGVGRPQGAAFGWLPWRAFLRFTLGTLIACWLLFATTVLLLRYVVLPEIARYQPEIEQLASQAVGLPVRIGSLHAGWEGLRPELVLDHMRVLDRQGGEALSFRRVEAVLSWRSLAYRDFRLHRLLAEGPTVVAERLADGRVFAAGFQVYPSAGGDAALADWALRQEQIVIAGARVVWRDAMRMPANSAGEVPTLNLEAVDLRLENRRRIHRFSFQASPPADLSGRIDLRGELRGLRLAQFEEWQGQVYLAAPTIDLANWLPWVEPPIKLSQGRGGMRLWGRVDGLGLAEVSADLALADVRVRLDAAPADESTLPELDLTRFAGRLGVRREAGTIHVTGQDISLSLRQGLDIPRTGFHVQWTPIAPAQGGGSDGLVVVPQIDVGHLAELATYLPLDRNSRETLQGYAPQGELRNLNLLWRGNAERLQSYRLKVDFAGLGMRPHGLLPGFENLSGSLDADEAKGQLELASTPLALEFPAVFTEPRVVLDELNAKVGWTMHAGLLDVLLQEAAFAGPDAVGSGSGRYRLALSDEAAAEFKLPGHLDLTAHLSAAEPTAVWRYLPHLIAEDVRHWVRDAVRGGRVREADLVLRGPLGEFPFPRNERGQFLVTAKVSDGRLLYAPAWPEVSELETELRFEGSGASFAAQQASIAGVKLGVVRAAIPDFAAAPRLSIDGEAQGPLPGFIRFLDQSPLGEMLGRFYEEIRLSGDGKLKLGLDIPLGDPSATRVKGDFDLVAGSAIVDPLLPPVTGLSGRVSFSESAAQANALSGQLFGRPLRVDLRAASKEVRVAAFGEATAEELQRQYPSPLLQAVSGTLPWQAAVAVRDGRVGFSVQSSLEGLQSTLPAPFGKTAAATLPVRFTRVALKPTGSPRSGRGAKIVAAVPRDQLQLEIGKVAGATLIRRLDNGRAAIERGIVAVGDDWSAAPVPEQGLRVVVKLPEIDLDLWRAAWSGPVSGGEGSALAEGIDWPTPQFELRAKTVRLISRQWRDVSVLAVPVRGGLSGQIEARDMAGEWSWDNVGKGTLRARLKQLVLPDATSNGNGAEAAANGRVEKPDDLPAVDLVADELILGQRRLGRLEVAAENVAGRWQVPRFELSSADGKIAGSGVWTPAAPTTPAATEVDLAVDAADIGRLLTRFGYPNAVRRGEGRLAGRLIWLGPPTTLHAPTLSGHLDLQAERGQFNKLEPGIGKLLSLLSLQMLPRRITLDFRDVFSEGFAFENIGSNVLVSNGVFSTENLVIEGPAAKVLMKGNADLVKDQTRVHVTVQPELGTSVAIGAAMAVNPAVGVAALLAQKLLRDPFNKAFAFEYEITGSLSDPQIRKVGGPAVTLPGAPVASEPGKTK